MKALRYQYERHWDSKLVSQYDDRNNCGESHLPNETVESVTALMKNGKRLLDVGCGNGNMLKLMNPNFVEINGCDVSINALTQAKQNNMIAVCTDFNEGHLPYKGDSFDCILVLEVLEHVIDPLRQLKELKRILTSNGQLLLTTPNFRYFRNLLKLLLKGNFPHTTRDDFIWGGGHFHYFTLKDLTLLFSKAGFKRISFHVNKCQFERSWKRKLLYRLFGESIFIEYFCGGIIAEAFKE